MHISSKNKSFSCRYSLDQCLDQKFFSFTLLYKDDDLFQNLISLLFALNQELAKSRASDAYVNVLVVPLSVKKTHPRYQDFNFIFAPIAHYVYNSLISDARIKKMLKRPNTALTHTAYNDILTSNTLPQPY